MTMFCPACKTELVPGQLEKFETLEQHVCDPNEEYPREPAPTVVCPNQQCPAGQNNVFWDAASGEGPYRTGSWSRCKWFYNWIDGNSAPFGSYSRAINFSCSYHDEDRSLRIGKNLVIRREVTYASNDYGDKVGKRVRYTWWWKGILWIPGWRMLLHCLKTLRRNPKEAPQYIDRAQWPRAEWWRKAAGWWARTFYKNFLTGSQHEAR